jgi:hypothetical protein
VKVRKVLSICSSNLIEITSDGGGHRACAVTGKGIKELYRQGLSDVDLLEIAMTAGSQSDDMAKRQLLFGLLRMREEGLCVVKENGVIIAPVTEISLHPGAEIRGTVSFLTEFGSDIRQDPPDLTTFCQLKGTCGGRPAHELVQFLLHKLTALPVEESLSDSFRLKSYSSVINKLFYRGKPLTDLFATTVGTDAALRWMKDQLNKKGAIPVDEEDTVNGNGDLTYRYVRILQVELKGSCRPFTIPIHYEIIRTRHMSPVSHKVYEWTRLKFGLESGPKNFLKRSGFTIESSCSDGERM